jgi:hypothetical protein
MICVSERLGEAIVQSLSNPPLFTLGDLAVRFCFAFIGSRPPTFHNQ